jgi:YD repeat-containing protein
MAGWRSNAPRARRQHRAAQHHTRPRPAYGAQQASAGSSSTTITYAYDNLYRLTNTTYSTGQVFTYTYDAVGNLLTQTTLTNTTVYTYGIANRVTNVGCQAYTWDNNGNLLSDGVLTYTYDSPNRPVAITQGANTYVFGYDGMGDRRGGRL